MKVEITLENNQQVSSDLSTLFAQSHYTVLYFYPKDDTPGCTLEANEFNELTEQFHQLNCQIIGVSKDTHKSHCAFQSKYWLQFPLISDQDMVLSKERWVVWEKSMYGKKYTWIIRSTFLIDSSGKVREKRYNVSATNHAKNVLEKLSKVVMDR